MGIHIWVGCLHGDSHMGRMSYGDSWDSYLGRIPSLGLTNG